MPTYDFKCLSCGHDFSLTLTVKERESGKIKCPSCNSTKIEQVITSFFVKTSKKS